MLFRSGRVSIEYLPRPGGLAYEFIEQLAGEASCVGEGNAFGFYHRDVMEERAKQFVQENPLAEENPLTEAILMDWIASLPWDESNYLTLNFNW